MRVGPKRGFVLVAVVATLLSGCISFGQPTEVRISAGENTRVTQLLYADLTGDGTDDLVALTSDSLIHRLEPCGPGCLTPREVVAASTIAQPTGLTSADFDGDGAEDIVVKGFVIEVFFGSRGGPGRPEGLAQADSATIPIGSSEPIAADLTGDGHPDLGVLYPTRPGFLPAHLGYGIVPGDGNGGFGALMPVADGLFDDRAFDAKLTVGDVNGDGLAEGVAWGHSYDAGAIVAPTIVVLSPSGGVLAEWQEPGGGYLTSVAAGDLDGDGDDDLAVGVSRHGRQLEADEIGLLRSTPTGLEPFGPSVLAPRTNAYDIEVVDINADGHPEVVATAGFQPGGSGWISWWRGNAAGFVQPPDRHDRELPKSVGVFAFGATGLAVPDLALGQQGGAFSAIYALPNTSD